MGNKQNQRIRSKLLIMGKLLLSIYLIVFVAAHVTSSSGAYFTDSQKETQALQAGTWWDGSELEFVEDSTQTTGEQNDKQTVNVALQNNGHAMNGSTHYQVMFSKAGDPKEGDVIKEGEITPLQTGETVTLSHETADTGSYRFKVMQRDGYEDDNDKSKSQLSDKIIIKPADTNQQNDQDKASKTKQDKSGDKPKESADDKQTSDEKQPETNATDKEDNEVNNGSETIDSGDPDVKQDTEENTSDTMKNKDD